MRQGCIATILAVAAFVAAPAAHAAGLRAGVASVDASWHVGASAGQYASDGTFAGEHGLDPTAHSTRRSASYGIQSRVSVRATFTFVSTNGARRRVGALQEGGRWVAAEPLAAGERAVVEPGAVRDRFDNFNGEGAG